MRHGWRAALGVVVALALASCATVPPPRPAAPEARPPAPAPEKPPPVVPPTSPYRLDREPAFDIGLAIDRDTIMVEPVGGATLSWRAPDGAERTTVVRERLRLRRSGTQVLVEPQGHVRAVPLAILDPTDTLWIGDASMVSGGRGALAWNGRHWRGRFKVFLSPRGRMTLATRVSLERYLLGVVPGEIGALRDSVLEAGRAQAIAARSYTLFYRGRRGAEGFDLYSSVEDQVYGPVESEKPLATRCVESTRGQVSLFGGEPIRANYCSTCGGITADVWEAWPTEPRGYLVGIADRGASGPDHCAQSPQYRWRETWPVDQFAATITRWAPTQQVPLPPGGLGEIRDVRVDARSRSGRVWRLRVVTSNGDVLIPAYSLRQVLRRPSGGDAILRSNLFKIAARREGGRVVEVIASGAGSGHGVGLCQTGALAMARAGAKAGEILAHYYAGTEVRRLY